MNKSEWKIIVSALEDYIIKIEDETGMFADISVLDTYSKAIIEMSDAK